MSCKGDKPRGSHKEYVAGAEKINWHREADRVISDGLSPEKVVLCSDCGRSVRDSECCCCIGGKE